MNDGDEVVFMIIIICIFLAVWKAYEIVALIPFHDLVCK